MSMCMCLLGVFQPIIRATPAYFFLHYAAQTAHVCPPNTPTSNVDHKVLYICVHECEANDKKTATINLGERLAEERAGVGDVANGSDSPPSQPPQAGQVKDTPCGNWS